MTSEPQVAPSEELPVYERSMTPSMKELVDNLGKLATSEEKIVHCLNFMQAALADKTPRFKDYWDTKKICLPLFKDELPFSTRSTLWSQYIQISTEARHLKDILDEQSAFAVEQIDLAIQAVEADLEKQAEILAQSTWTLLEGCYFLEPKEDLYVTLQRELNILNLHATRINSLRKEVIRTEMRIRHKNKFFDRLSAAGDKVFPRRKELIRQISTEFTSDIQAFAREAFTDEALRQTPLFALRNEIKTLQMVAKELTLDTQAFTETRLVLSQCWDLLKERDLERKKEMADQKEVHMKSVELVMDKIRPFAERCQVPTFTLEEAMKQSNEILTWMKGIQLGREEVRFLKDEVAKARSPVHERMDKEQEAREKEVQESQRQRRDKIEEFKRHLQEAHDQIENKGLDELNTLRDQLQKELSLLLTTHAERELLEHAVKELRDKIMDKKEKAIASLSDEQKNSLHHLEQMLEDWKNQKQEIRTQLDTYRKILSGSGFDIEKAMRYQKLMDEEKLRLEKANAAIEDIEEKIEEFES